MLCYLMIAHSPVLDQKNGTLSLTTDANTFTFSRNSSNVFYFNKCIQIYFIQLSWAPLNNFGWFWRYINSLWLIDWLIDWQIKVLVFIACKLWDVAVMKLQNTSQNRSPYFLNFVQLCINVCIHLFPFSLRFSSLLLICISGFMAWIIRVYIYSYYSSQGSLLWK